MTVIGCDPQVASPAFATWPARETWQLKIEGEGAVRLCALYAATYEWAVANAPDDLQACFIERPFGRFNKQALDHACGVLQVALVHGLSRHFSHPVSVFEISTGTWKKEALGSGRAKKDDVKLWALCERRKAVTQDEADALAISCAGYKLLSTGEATTKGATTDA